MAKKQDEKIIGYVKKETMYLAAAVSLCIGFFIGSVFVSYKLGTMGGTGQQMPPQQQAQSGGGQDMSVEISAKILELEQVVKQDPKNVNAWVSLGNLFFDSNQYKNSIEAYEKALLLKPGVPPVLTDLGVMYRRNGQPDKAIEKFELAIKADPQFEVAMFNKGIVLMHDLNDLEGAIKAWEDLVNKKPMAMAPNGESVDALLQRLKKNGSL